MGFLDWLFRIFGFGEKRQQQKCRAMSAAELDSYLGGKTKTGTDALEKEVFSKFAEIKHILLEIKTELKEFEARDLEAEEGNQRLRKIVETSKRNLIKQMNYLAEKLSPPEERDYAVLQQYCLNSSAMLEKELNTFGRSVMYTGILMKKEVKNLGTYIGELNKTFLELKGFFENSPVKGLIEVKTKLRGLNTELEARDSLRREIAHARKQAAELAEDKTRKQAQLQGLANSPGAEEFKTLQERKAKLSKEKMEIKNKLLNLLSPLDKPLGRFLRLVESKNYIISESEQALLSAYLQNPFIAVRRDPNAFALKKLLVELEKLIKDSRISLKEKEKLKKLRAIQELMEYDFFSELFWKLNSIDADIIAADKSLSSSKVCSDINALEKDITALERRIAEQHAAISLQEQKLAQKEEEIAAFKTSLESALEKAASERILLRLEASGEPA